MLFTDCHFPILEYQGNNPEKWGVYHGESFRKAINELALIRRELMLQKNPSLKSQLKELATLQFESTEIQAPHIAKELLGISLGANLDLTDLVILNNYTDFRDIILSDEGCSTLAINKGKSNLAGQTWDMHGSAKQYLCLIRVPETDFNPASLILSLVGCVGLMGVNQHQMMVGVNNINTRGAKPGIIWPALVRQLLHHNTFQSMENQLLSLKVTSGHNYMLSSPEKSHHWEITPDANDQVGKVTNEVQGVSFHTNHCLGQNVSKAEDKNSISSTTFNRYHLLEKKAQSIKNFQELYQLLTDHEEYPKSICSHFQANTQDPSQTCGGGIVDWNTNTIRFWRGCPKYDKNYMSHDFKLSNSSFHRI